MHGIFPYKETKGSKMYKKVTRIQPFLQKIIKEVVLSKWCLRFTSQKRKGGLLVPALTPSREESFREDLRFWDQDHFVFYKGKGSRAQESHPWRINF